MKDGEERTVNELSRRPKREQEFTFEGACNTLFSATP